MNERYLFRGKRKDNGQWIEGDLVHSQTTTRGIITEIYTLDMAYEVDPETVGQCTGKTDCKDKFIFYGDLLRLTGSDGDCSIYKVLYSNDHAGWAIQEIDCGAIDRMDSWEIIRECFEVIGNEFDNPELLEVQNG